MKMFGLPLRKGFSMKVNGIHLTRPDMHNIAAEVGVRTNDVLIENGVLTVYNTSQTCQDIIADGALSAFVAMAIDIPHENITNIQEVEEEPVEMDFDLDEFDDD